jgi:hypothetical protein
MKDKMTPTPWEARIEQDHSIHISSSSDSITYVICTCYCEPLDETTKADAAAIVSAVNGTWGTGINPEGVPEIKKCLEELLVQFEKVVDPKYTLDFMLIREAKAAIEKAQIK